jgi:hypothetical protein
VNSAPRRADTSDVRHATDSYFVRLGGEPLVGNGIDGRTPAGREGLGGQGPQRRRRRRRGVSGRSVFIVLVVIGLGTWTAWAAQRPGGVSGTVNGWISHVRGDVQKVSADPDVSRARRYFNGQYTATGRYPQMSESDLGAVGIGVGVNIQNCSPQAIVIQGASGAGTASRLLVAGKDLGELQGKYGCPADLANPAPWSAPKS